MMMLVGEWFVFVCMTSFWVSLILLLMYLLHAIGKFYEPIFFLARTVSDPTLLS